MSASRPPAASPSDAERWLAAVVEAQETRADLAVSVAIDGLALVDSRSTADMGHEVRVRDGRAVSCTCLAYRTRGLCPHVIYAGIRLWEMEMGVDLSQAGARALVPTLRNRYVGAPRERRLVGPAARDWRNDPEHQLPANTGGKLND